MEFSNNIQQILDLNLINETDHITCHIMCNIYGELGQKYANIPNPTEQEKQLAQYYGEIYGALLEKLF